MICRIHIWLTALECVQTVFQSLYCIYASTFAGASKLKKTQRNSIKYTYKMDNSTIVTVSSHYSLLYSQRINTMSWIRFDLIQDNRIAWNYKIWLNLEINGMINFDENKRNYGQFGRRSTFNGTSIFCIHKFTIDRRSRRWHTILL